MPWLELVIAYLVFFTSHSIPVRPAIKSKLVSALGKPGFIISYSLVSLGALYWLIAASSRAPHVEIWAWQPWQNLVPLLAMPVSFCLAALALGVPNPFSFGGGHGRFNAKTPGLLKWMRHPLLVAMMVWALAHLVPNGDLAHVLLFGTFAAFAFAGMKIIDRRKRREMGVKMWNERLAKARQAKGFLCMPLSIFFGRSVIGIAVYGVVIFAHAALFGVHPLI